MVEIGIPFSDPVADGPVIQASTQAALANGIRLSECFDVARQTKRSSNAAVVFLTYYNPILRHGLERFAVASASAGVDGVICADLPSQEAHPLQACLAAHGIDLIPMVAPTSTDERLQLAGQVGSGFIYCVSRTGVTGARDSLNEGLEQFLGRVRGATALPRAVGFGVSTPEQARAVAALAEGVIVGSALVKLIDESAPESVSANVERFGRSMREGMDDGR